MLKSYLNDMAIFIEKEIEKEFIEIKYPNVLAEGMKYSVLNGGKRMRPILLFLILEILGEKIEKGVKTAIALEFIHSYSLVHDDLPALDNDDYRRGKLTTHKKFGEAQAILIGDALLTHAFYLLSEKNKNIIEDKKIIEIISKVSLYSGINGMIGGQMIDIESENVKIDKETLKYIHTNKTGKLIKLPVEIACIIANADEKLRKDLSEYAELIGLAFQIKDDILDVEGDFEELGKETEHDINKSTYPSIYGMEESKKILTDTIFKAKKIIEKNFSGEKAEILLEFTDYIEKRKK